MFRPQSIVDTKSTVFSVMIFGLVLILAIPVIFPRLSDDFSDFHILLHLTGIGFASFLTAVAVTAYRRVRTRRLLFTSVAFGTFILAEIFWLIDAAWESKYYFWTFSSYELGHVIILFTLLMFALSVFRRD